MRRSIIAVLILMLCLSIAGCGKGSDNVQETQSWNYSPYIPLKEEERADSPYICRLAPSENGFEAEWFDANSKELSHTIICQEYVKDGEGEIAASVDATSNKVKLSNLKKDCEYVLFVVRNADGKESQKRRFKTGYVPGTVVNYLHPQDKAYAFSGKFLCSPSIVRLPSGTLLASMDVYASGAPQNLTFIYRSTDNGASWEYLTDLYPCFWGKLFVHREKLYMFALSTEYGKLFIGCSEDEGKTWTQPATILPGRARMSEGGPHKSVMPVISYKGRLWTGIDFGSWKLGGHANTLLSINEDDDLLVPENWVCPEFVKYNPEWEGTVKGEVRGCLEGNAVVAPDGTICNFLRYQIEKCTPNHGKALILKGDADHPEKQLEFWRVVDFNSALSKFNVIKDDKTGNYISIASKVTNAETPKQRNVLVLLYSKDLINWNEAKVLLDYSSMPPEKVGFQYVDFIIEGEDILYLSRTAFNNADTYHNSNYITFHRIENYNQYLYKQD